MALTTPLGSSACPACGTTYDYGVAVCPKDGTVLSGWKAPITGEHDPVIGLKLGDFVVEKRIAHGGMGIVYRAVHPLIGRQVAVKVLRPEMASNPQQVERFLAEAKAISVIQHQGIVTVFSYDKLPDGRQYMVMELLEGEALDMVIAREAPLPYSLALPLLDQMLDALSAAHGAGVIHRDMKPSNVFLARQTNGTKVVKLVDFGLAKQTPLGDPNAQAYARASLIAGTPEYISPEQIRGEAATARTDLYGFAVVAFEMLTKKIPFVGQTVVDTLEMHARRVPPHVKVFRGDVPGPLDDLIFRMMAKRPEDRPSSAEAARQELQRLMREMNIDTSLQPRDAPTSPSLPEIPAFVVPPVAPNKTRPMTLVLLGLIIVASAAGAFWLGRTPQDPPVAALPEVVPTLPGTVNVPLPAQHLDPPPVAPGVAPPVAPTQPTVPVAVADPTPVLMVADDPAGDPPGGKTKAGKKRPFQELEGLSDTDWRRKMQKRLELNWSRLEKKSQASDAPTSNAKTFYEVVRKAVDDAKGKKERAVAASKVANWETKFLK